MELSEARLAANRANSAKSTGPRTSEGKAASRANAFKHGFCAEVVVGASEAQTFGIPTETISITPTPRPTPTPEFEGWAAGQAGLLAARIEHCQETERAIRDLIVLRAGINWDSDRRTEAIRLGDLISRRPEEISARLHETLHGCEWLLGRWALLAHAIASQGSWTPEQERLAFDLLGTPIGFREGNRPWTTLDLEGREVDPIAGGADLARRQVDHLLELQERLTPLDQAARELAEAGLGGDSDPDLKRLHRYEASLQRRLQWALDLFQQLRTARQNHEPDQPVLQPEPVSEAVPVPELEPESEPTGDLPVAARSTPPIESPRAEKKRIKAEARRDSRRRQLDARRS